MSCDNCTHSRKPYKHKGRKFKTVGDGLITRRRKVMPGAETEIRGDGFVFPQRRVKKSKKKDSLWDLS